MVGDRGIQLDRIIDGELIIEPYPGVAEGAGIWIDNEPWAEDEWDSWADPHMEYRIAEDAKPRGDEFIIIIAMDALLSDPGLEEVKVRVTDFHENWTRTDNLLEDIDGLYTVTEVGIIEQNYQGTTVLADFCSVPVCDRVAGIYTLDYVAQVVTSDYIEPPDFLWSVINSPTHEGSAGLAEINVPIYRLDPELDRYEIYNELFPPHGYQCNVHYYSRGLELLIPPGEVAPVVIDFWRYSVQPMHEEDYDTCPHLYLSDRDHLIGQEGDFDEDSWKDFSIAVANDTELWLTYKHVIDYAWFGSSERGGFLPISCDPDKGFKQDYTVDVLDCGVERVQIDVETKTADIGIQSRGDAYFIFSHGWPPPMIGYEQLTQITSLSPFPNPDPNLPDRIPLSDWKYVSGLATEVDWLICSACFLLNDASYQIWQQLLIPNSVDGICGFKDFNFRNMLPLHSYPNHPGQEFYQAFSERLTDYEGPHHYLWGCQPSSVPAVTAWMENACVWAMHISAGFHPGQAWHGLMSCAAVDGEYRYVLRTRRPDCWWEPDPSFEINVLH